jgi:hypothetical protein
MEKRTIPDQVIKTLGVPGGAEGWYFALANAISDSRLEEENDFFLVIAWDKPPKDPLLQTKTACKVYGLFRDHATFWENLSKLPVDQRYGYEVLPSSKPCRGYWDIEFCLMLTGSQQVDEATRDTHILMRAWIEKLKQTIKCLFNVEAKVAVLDGTRVIPSQNVESEEIKVKFSFHVILCNVAFVCNKSRAFEQVKEKMPTLYNLGAEMSLTWIPPKETEGAPDTKVYSNNQLFRCLSCAKRGSSTPLIFATTELTETIDPKDTFVSILHKEKNNAAYYRDNDIFLVSEPPQKRKKKNGNNSSDEDDDTTPAKKKKKLKLGSSVGDDDGDDNHLHVQEMLAKYPKEMKNIHDELQNLLRSWGDCNTKVEKLVRVTKNLRYQCRNVNSRSCILSKEAHQSNTPILWLDSSEETSEGYLAKHYTVIYNCRSSECQGQGVIGEMILDTRLGRYKCTMVNPPTFHNTPKGLAFRVANDSGVNEEDADNCNETQDIPNNSNNNNNQDAISPPSIQAFQQLLLLQTPVQASDGEEDSDSDENKSSDDGDKNETSNEPSHQYTDLDSRNIRGYGWSRQDLQTFNPNKTYDSVKAEQEKSLCKILSPGVMFLKFKDNGKSLLHDHYTYDGMQKYLKPITYYKKKEPDSKPESARFFGAWTDDPESRTYHTVTCDPSKDRLFTGPNDLNVWPGMTAELLKNISSADKVQELVKPIVSHVLDVIVNGVQDHAEWLLDWMANIVQRPDKKTQVPIVITGKQGVGKGIIFDFFREYVLGLAVTTQIQNPGQDLFARFSNKHVNKVLIQMDEGDGLAKYADCLKNLITSTHLNYEIKGLMPMTALNFINVIITTNHERPVLVETSDRRFVLFKASDMHLPNPSYYSKLGSHLKNPKVARAFYQFLMARNLSKYVDNFQASRPVTEYYLQSRKSSISNFHKFISALVNSKKYVKVEDTSAMVDYVPPTAIIANAHPKAMFKDFTIFLESGRYQSTMTATGFASKIKSVDGISKANRRDGTPFYILNYTVIREVLQKNNEFDDEVTFD